jgi:transposase
VRVDIIKTRYKDRVYKSALLRTSYRQNGKLKHETLANLSALPWDVIYMIQRSLKGETFMPAEAALKITRSRTHGAVWTVWQMMRKLKLPELLSNRDEPWRDRALGMILARILSPSSKRFAVKWWQGTSLPEWLPGAADVSVQMLYQAMDRLLPRQRSIEKRLAKRHLKDGTLVLFDVTSSYMEGRCCPLSAFGYNRDQKRGKMQIVWGLLTNEEGCPVAVEVFSGNTRDPQALTNQIDRLRSEFGLSEVIVVGDRGLITRVHRRVLSEHGYAWITALRAPAIRKLHQHGALQLSIFDEHDIAEIRDPDHPDRRLIMCRNWEVARERRRKRQDLLQATHKQLSKIRDRVVRGRLKDEQKIALAVGQVINKFRVGKHFEVHIGPGSLEFTIDEDAVTQEAALDGIYVVETTADIERLSSEEVVSGYKSLKHVERAFRTMKTMALEIRPIYHRLAGRVRAHAFLCMLAYYVQWHMERALALLRDEEPDSYQSFQYVLCRLGELQLNTVEIEGATLDLVTEPDEEQRRFLEHLSVKSLVPRNRELQKH